MGTATIVSFDGSDTGTAKTNIENLAFASADKAITWTLGNTTFVARYEH